MGDVLTRSLDWVTLEPDERYRQVTVRLWGKGVVLRDEVEGLAIAGARRLRVRSGQLILSRIDARNGAIGIVPDELDGAIVSNDFPSFDLDPSRLLPAYLGWLSKSGNFVDQCRAASEGTTNRIRLNEDRFVAIEIPLPPLDEQRRIATRLNRVAAGVEEIERLQAQVASDTPNVLALLAHRPDFTPGQKLALGWVDATLSDVLHEARNPVKVDAAAEYPNLGIYSFGRGLFLKPPISGARTSASTLYRVRAGQFVYSRLFAFEGAYGIVTDKFDGYCVSNEYPTFDLDGDRVGPEFLWAYFQSPRVWSTIAAGSKGLGHRRQRVQPQQLLAHRLMLPPISWQDRIALVTSMMERLTSWSEGVVDPTKAVVASMFAREQGDSSSAST